MLYATFLFIAYFCFCSCLQYSPKQQAAIELSDSEQLFNDFYNLFEASIENTEVVETVEPTSSKVETTDNVSTELSADENNYAVESIGFEPLSLDELLSVAKAHGLKATRKWKRETLIKRLNAIAEVC